jgi:pyridoxal phosphate enzyme (YggS family)
MIHGVDSLSLLKEINKQAQKIDQKINCLLQVHIAQEETKFGMDEVELMEAIEQRIHLPNIVIRGLMGMASFSADKILVSGEFEYLHRLFTKTGDSIRNSEFNTLSMGMSGDYPIALQKGSNMVRVGSLLFGAREKRS